MKAYVLLVCAAALLAFAATRVWAPDAPGNWVRAALCFALLGMVFQKQSYRVQSGALAGSIAFLPYLSGVFLAPSWVSVVGVSVATALADVGMVRKRGRVKVAFNIAQHCLAISMAVLAYTALGGFSLLQRSAVSPIPFVAACLAYLVVNTFAVAGAIALSEQRNLLSVWKRSTAGIWFYDLTSIPVIYGCSLVYIYFDIAGLLVLGALLMGARQLFSTNRQLESTNSELLQVLVAAIEARDPYTSGHSLRVAHFSQIIARALNLSKREVERVRIAALLHDVGKIDERFAAILQKPGRLTEEERRTIELHPIKSAELVAMVSQLEHAVKPVRHHHENWDGTGYPDRIAGEAIPLASRIIMFADTIDAMTTDRPYRRALGPAEVRAELLRMKGKQFDPRICDVLVDSPLFTEIFSGIPEPARISSDAGPMVAA